MAYPRTTAKAPSRIAIDQETAGEIMPKTIRGRLKQTNVTMTLALVHRLQRDRKELNMATTELPINADQDDIPESFSNNFDRLATHLGLSSMCPYPRRLRRMARVKQEPQHRRARFRLTARQDESLLAGRKLSLHRPDLSV